MVSGYEISSSTRLRMCAGGVNNTRAIAIPMARVCYVRYGVGLRRNMHAIRLSFLFSHLTRSIRRNCVISVMNRNYCVIKKSREYMKTRLGTCGSLNVRTNTNRMIQKSWGAAIFGLALLPLVVFANDPMLGSFDATDPFVPMGQDTPVYGFTSGVSDPVLGLGRGFDSNREAIKDTCLQGVPYYDGASFGSLEFEHMLSNAQTENFLSVVAGGGYKSSAFKIRASTSFKQSSAVSKYSDVYIFRYIIKLNNEVLSSSGLNSVGTTYYNQGAANFLTICGDKYVDQREIGGALFYSVKLDFANEDEKKAFNFQLAAKGGVVGRWNAHSEFEKAAKSLNMRGSITIRAIQMGGDPRMLGTILGAPIGATEAPVLACSFADLAACGAMMNAINTYATDSVSGFPSQIGAIDPTNPVGSSITGYHLLGYDAAGVLLTPDILPIEVHQARVRLLQQVEQNQDDLLRVVRLQTSFIAHLTSDKYDALAQLATDLQANGNALRTAGLICFEYWEQCLYQEQVANVYLKPIDRTLLELPLPPSIGPGYFHYNDVVHYSDGLGSYWRVKTAGATVRQVTTWYGLKYWKATQWFTINPVKDPNNKFRLLNALELAIIPRMGVGSDQSISARGLWNMAGRDYSIFSLPCKPPYSWKDLGIITGDFITTPTLVCSP